MKGQLRLYAGLSRSSSLENMPLSSHNMFAHGRRTTCHSISRPLNNVKAKLANGKRTSVSPAKLNSAKGRTSQAPKISKLAQVRDKMKIVGTRSDNATKISNIETLPLERSSNVSVEQETGEDAILMDAEEGENFHFQEAYLSDGPGDDTFEEIKGRTFQWNCRLFRRPVMTDDSYFENFKGLKGELKPLLQSKGELFQKFEKLDLHYQNALPLVCYIFNLKNLKIWGWFLPYKT